MSGRWRPRAGLLALGALAALAGHLASGEGIPPLYDSLGVAPPYRYVCVPAGVNPDLHPRPDPATQTVPVQGGASPAIEFTTDEQPIPQVQFIVGGGALTLPPGTSSVTVTATPVVPPAALPTDGTIDGNVYDIRVTATGGPVTLSPGGLATIVLRGEPLGRIANLEQFDGTAWRKLDAQPVGTADIFGGNVTSFTTFALVLPGTPQTHGAAGCPPSTTPVSPGAGSGATTAVTTGAAAAGGSSSTPIAIAVVAVMALGVVAGLLVLLRRSDRPAPPRGGGGGHRGGGTGGRTGGGRTGGARGGASDRGTPPRDRRRR